MSHLLAIAVGPVQEFIAAARRTRDLWFGSYLLSEISRAVAKSVEADGGELIFPASPDAENVANVILAELPGGEPRDVSARAKRAAQERWKKFADEARQEASRAIRQDIWDDQVNDVIEFYAAWIERSSDYRADRGRLMRLLAGRKNCRDFLPAQGLAGVPKSSLDGQRESVLKDPARERWPERFRPRLRIREGEQLDVVGLVKRLAEGNRPYPSVSRIAADLWVRGNLHRIHDVISACEDLRTKGIIRRLDTDIFPQFSGFPYEGAAVYTCRHHELIEETEIKEGQLRDLRDALARLPEPNPYFVVLVADGDKVGAAISALTSPDAHRAFSTKLASFADEAQKLVTDHQGVLVYAGGDDVLAFVPVDKCLRCARDLSEKFVALLADYKNDKGESPTLSVGIAIGHFLENLEDLLQYGRDAEREAKNPDRNGLAVHLHKRGGSPVQVRSQWTDRLDERLARYAELIRLEAIPSKLPYDLRKLADLYDKWPQDTLVQALQTDVLRVIRDKQPKAGRGHIKEIEKLVQTRLTDAASLHRFSKELLIARQIATALRQAEGRAVATEEVTP
jgi:CRISPR-associated protein Cmr2